MKENWAMQRWLKFLGRMLLFQQLPEVLLAIFFFSLLNSAPGGCTGRPLVFPIPTSAFSSPPLLFPFISKGHFRGCLFKTRPR